VRMKRRCIYTGMNTTSIPEIFARYTQAKWLASKHGQTVYTLFCQFSETYRNAIQ
jgi:hypothetical protein